MLLFLDSYFQQVHLIVCDMQSCTVTARCGLLFFNRVLVELMHIMQVVGVWWTGLCNLRFVVGCGSLLIVRVVVFSRGGLHSC